MNQDDQPSQRQIRESLAQFRCPCCKSDLLLRENGELYCTQCRGNKVSESQLPLREDETKYAFALCDTVIDILASGRNDREFAGLIRVYLHWLMTQRPSLFRAPSPGGISPSAMRGMLVRYVQQNILDTVIKCFPCDVMLFDSDPESPLECAICGGTDVGAHDVVLLQIAHMVNRGISLK